MNSRIEIKGACEHNLKNVDLEIERNQITIMTGVSGSGKSSLAFDTILAEAQRRFFYTLSNYSRQFLDLGSRPAVKSVSGLSPAIALAQNETLPSRRATVASLSDVTELLGVLFARFGTRYCPTHDLETAGQSIEDIAGNILRRFDDQTLAICAPLAEDKKGHFATQMRKAAKNGFVRAYVDGELVTLNPIPDLVKTEKHTIKIIVDVVKVSAKNRQRLTRSLQTGLEESIGYGEYFPMPNRNSLALKNGARFSVKGGCPECGFSWGTLDSRYFNPNSLGRCHECDGLGQISHDDEDIWGGDDFDEAHLDFNAQRCTECGGSGIDVRMNFVRLGDRTVSSFHQGSIRQALTDLAKLSSHSENPAYVRVYEQLVANMGRIVKLGLDYLQLNRRVRSLSGGELQRLKLSGIIGEKLSGVLYIFDEPSQGLHEKEIEKLCESLSELKRQGNTILLVDHDETLMRFADWIVDLGPGGGARGGHLIAKFQPKHAAKHQTNSVTAKHLCRAQPVFKTRRRKPVSGEILIKNPRLNNLKIDCVRLKKQAFNVVCGVSGAGKSSLVLSVLFENVVGLIDDEQHYRFRYCDSISGLDDISTIHMIDRRPVAKSSVSMPATYLDIFTDLRELYAKLPQAQVAGIDAAAFSLAREGGRCEACKGRGQMNLQMRFLADAKVKCYVCEGKRYRPHLQNVRFNGLNLSEVLALTIDEALAHFGNFRKIKRRLQPAVDLGLGYLKLGQPSSSLSGGEAQRLKLVPFFSRNHSDEDLLLLDEPTTGLHFEDVTKLLSGLHSLVDRGTTIVVIEHNDDVIQSADWQVVLGPGSAENGGRLIYEGPTKKVSSKQPSAELEVQSPL